MIDDLIESDDVDGVNRDLDVTTRWTVFPAPELHDDDEDGTLDVVLGQGRGMIGVRYNKAG